MSKRTKRGKGYSKRDDRSIIEYVNEYGTTAGCRLVAKILGRTESGVNQHYYSKLVAKKTPKSESVFSVANLEKHIQANKSNTTIEVPTKLSQEEVKDVRINVKGVEIYISFKQSV